jgi:serine/threonine-protein kinase mTOR
VSSLRSPTNTQDAREVQNARALQVLARVKEKLTGRDFTPTTTTTGPNGAANLTPGQRLEASSGGAMELGAIVAAAALDGGSAGVERRGEGELLVAEQVEKLIKQATNTENLCQHYIGWCSFW